MDLLYLFNHLFSYKFEIIFTLLSLFCVNSNHPVMGSILVMYLVTGEDFLYCIVCRWVLNLHMVYYVLFHPITQQAVYRVLYLTVLCFENSEKYAGTVKMLVNHCLRYIHFRIQEIHIITILYVTLEDFWNKYTSSYVTRGVLLWPPQK